MRSLIYIVIVLVLKSAVVLGVEECLPCNEIECDLSITQADCPKGEFLSANGSMCGCCPGCLGGMMAGTPGCNNNNEKRRCAPGLKCVLGPVTDPNFPPQNLCVLDKEKCSYTYHLVGSFMFLPQCDSREKFVAKQCKGDRHTGRCFCYDELGNKIFGSDWWRNADHMTCACSRMRSKRESDGYISTLHCTPNGNFEELQCDSGVCWCAIEKTGQVQPGTDSVPERMWTMLPCYNETSMGEQYLRQCESGAHYQQIIKRALFVHGTIKVTQNRIRCDYDGSFGNIIIEDGIASCTWRNGEKIRSYQTISKFVLNMNCYCARDLMKLKEMNSTLGLQCGGYGNYQTLQDEDGEIFCVDHDGFAATELSDPVKPLDCDLYLYYKQ